MKKLLLFIVLFISLTLTSCGSSSDYTKNDLNPTFYTGKTICFVYNPYSVNQLTYKGMMVGYVNQPVVKKAFTDAVSEFAQETKLNLKCIETISEATASDVVLDVKITEAVWDFGFSTAKMKTTIEYRMQPGNTLYTINGNRNSGGGSEQNNLKKSLKNATYNFLKQFGRP